MKARYFSWLLEKVGALYSEYTILCKQLFETEFRWDPSIDLDADRAEKGKELRLLYSHDTGKKCGCELEPCNVLEMMVALSCSMENIMGEPGNDHPGRWFFEMLDNLGLYGMTNEAFNEKYAKERLEKWMMRDYSRSGHGGLFPLRSGRKDQRKSPIWEQAGNYLSERYI